MKPLIFRQEISTKKGDKQILHWLIKQDHPWPSIAAHVRRWENVGNIFRTFNGSLVPAIGLEPKYFAYLLRSDFDEKEHIKPDGTFDRLAFAGYDGNPGGILWRGKSTGETSIEFDTRKSREGATFKFNGFEMATGTLADFLAKEVLPEITAACNASSDYLKEQAKQEVIASMRAKVAEMRADVNALEAQIDQAVF